MKLDSTSYFDKKLVKKIKRNPRLKKRVSKQLKLLVQNTRHPSLKLHKLTGKRSSQFSIWIEGNLRITFKIVGSTILLIDIVTHDEY